MALILEGEELILAPIDRVWDGLNDPEILLACIPGCETLEKSTDTEMSAVVTLRVGPIKVTFGGNVTLSNINAPSSYTITGEGKGGIAGFAKGGADVNLVATGPNETKLTYVAKADVGGKIAQLGSRLMYSTADKISKQFFSTFNEKVSAG